MAFATVQHGRYRGFSLADMQAEEAAYKVAVKNYNGGVNSVVSASVNGSSFTYRPYTEAQLDSWQAEKIGRAHV